MITFSGANENPSDVFNEKLRRMILTPHKDMIKRLEYVVKERKCVSVSREGVICLWTTTLKLHRVINTRDFNSRQSWVHDAKFIPENNKLVIVTDDRQLCIYDIFAIKPRLVACISSLESNPLCVSAAVDYEEDIDLILYGDDGGYVNVIHMHRKFLVDMAGGDVDINALTPAKLTKKDSLEKNHISLYRIKLHADWVLKVQYYPEMNAFVSCAREPTSSLVVYSLDADWRFGAESK
jgi:WD40 repeat protein